MPSYYSRVLGEASASSLREFREYPLKYLDWVNGGGPSENPSMRHGTAVHCALHEPEKFARRYITMPDMSLNSKAAKQEYLDATLGKLLGVERAYAGESAEVLRSSVNSQLSAAGIWVLSDSEYGTLCRMIDSLNMPCHSLARSLVARGKKELELRWVDEPSGISCKALVDSWDGDACVLSDLKRTIHVTSREFKSAVLNSGYGFQLSFYRRGLRAHGKDPRYSCFVCGSPERPYPWAVHDPPEDYLDWCDDRTSANLMELAACLERHDFPSINNGEAVTLKIQPERVFE